MNKKGDERVLSIYLYIIYIIVLVGVVSGVLIFYGSSMDIRKAEARLLIDKTIDCLSDEGKINSEVFSDNFNFLDFCKINLNDSSSEASSQIPYYLQIEIYNSTNCTISGKNYFCSDSLKNLTYGEKKYFEYCTLVDNKFPQCTVKYVYLLKDGQPILLKIYGVIDKYAQNS